MSRLLQRYRNGWLLKLAAAVCAVAPAILPAAVVELRHTSDPSGLIDQTTLHETPKLATTIVAPQTVSSYNFTHWTINGSRVQDFTGRAVNPAKFNIYERSNAVAHYCPTNQDSDSDGIPDWFELQVYNHLNHSASSDTDSDGASLFIEYLRGTHPNLADQIDSGGISRSRGSTKQIIINPDYVRLIERSQPAGYIDRVRVVKKGSSVSLSGVAKQYSDRRFIGWFLNGERIDDPLSAVPPKVTIHGETTVYARLELDKADADLDGLLDWWEMFTFGTIDEASSGDFDGDGVANLMEYNRNTSPLVHDLIAAGGISRANSQGFALNLGGYATYRLESNPPGLLNIVRSVESGSLVTTPDLWQNRLSGYVFGYWELNGIRQEDVVGISKGKLTFTVDEDLTATAHYFPETKDVDSDKILDWWEYAQFGNLQQSGNSDADNDGVSLRDEYQRGLSPRLYDFVTAGGVSRSGTSRMLLNLQFFERLRFGLFEDVLTEIFSEDPHRVSGWDFGPNCSPAVGDWDHDGDSDVFIASEEGLKVYQNIGTRDLLNLRDRSSSFSGLGNFSALLRHLAIAAGDWNGDGNSDLAVAGNGTVHLIESTGRFSGSQPDGGVSQVVTGSELAIPVFAELTGDGHVDLLVLLKDGTVRLYPHSGGSNPYGANATENILGISVPEAVSVASAEINGDQRTDILIADAEGRVWEFHQTIAGGFTLHSKVWAGTGRGFANRLMLAAADLDGDEDADALAGTEEGALLLLRDPRLGRPLGVKAAPGPNSILLTWDANRQSRIKGYHVYRQGFSEEAFAKLLEEFTPETRYLDESISLYGSYSYYVTSVAEIYLPGNSIPRVLESRPSELVEAESGRIKLHIPSAQATAGEKFSMQVSVYNSKALAGNGFKIRIRYPSEVLTPFTQIAPDSSTVKKTGLTTNLEVIDNAASAHGELVIESTGGTINPGNGVLFFVDFQVLATALDQSEYELAIHSAEAEGLDGVSLEVDITEPAKLAISGIGTLGDVDGDGEVTDLDKDLLRELMRHDAREATEVEMFAGDLNGDGELGPEDLVLLVHMLQGKPISE